MVGSLIQKEKGRESLEEIEDILKEELKHTHTHTQ
jgi:hypothetical protein